MHRFLSLRFGRLHNVKWAVAWASTILLFTIYHGFKSLYSTQRQAVICLDAGDRPGCSQCLFTRQSVGDAASTVLFQRIGRWSSYHRMSVCRDAGWRRFCVCQHSGGGDYIHNTYCYRLRDSHRTQRRDGLHTRQCLDGQLHHCVAEGSFRPFGADRNEGHRTGPGREEGQARRIDGSADRLAFYEGLEAAFARLARTHEQFAVPISISMTSRRSTINSGMRLATNCWFTSGSDLEIAPGTPT